MKIVDCHHHIIDPQRFNYPWMQWMPAAMQRHFTDQELKRELDRHGVSQTVLVQADDIVAETDFMLATAETTAWIGGVVGWVDMSDPVSTAKQLDRWQQQYSKLCGIRYMDHSQADCLLQAGVLASLEQLATRNLSFDLSILNAEEQLPHTVALTDTLAKTTPQLTLVVCHMGFPPVKARGWQPWADCITAIAQHPNCHIKLSAMDLVADLDNWSTGDLQPYVDHVISCFGTQRILWGSNWPVSLVGGSYSDLLEKHRKTLSCLSQTEQQAILSANAGRAYRLD